MADFYEIDAGTNKISKEILDQCFYIHTKLGPGLLESVYEECLFYFLSRKNLKVERQKILPINIDGLVIPSGLRLDVVVENKVIVELKAVERILPVHEAQVHSYLKLSGFSLGLLINFNVKSLKDGIRRIAMAQNQKNNFV